MKTSAWWAGLTDEDFRGYAVGVDMAKGSDRTVVLKIPIVAALEMPADQLAVVPRVFPSEWPQMSDDEKVKWLALRSVLVKNVRGVE